MHEPCFTDNSNNEVSDVMMEDFTAFDMLKIAVAEDDVNRLKMIMEKHGQDFIMNQRFEHGMNILNFAVDSESTDCVQFLATHLPKTY